MAEPATRAAAAANREIFFIEDAHPGFELPGP
jgi:hypothetical protein